MDTVSGAASSGDDRPALTDADLAAVGRLRDFAARFGGDEVAVIEHLGRAGARIAIVASDGQFGDVLVSSVQAAALVCERAAVPVGDWDRELTARVTPTAEDRLRMASRAR
jgi:hypothetical protein